MMENLPLYENYVLVLRRPSKELLKLTLLRMSQDELCNSILFYFCKQCNKFKTVHLDKIVDLRDFINNIFHEVAWTSDLSGMVYPMIYLYVKKQDCDKITI